MRKLILIVLGLLASNYIFAQNKAEQELSFVYVTHDENTDTQTLINRLKQKYKNTINYPDMRATIFYLSNGANPIIVKVNTEDDNRKDFENIIYSLQTKRAHDVNPGEDVERIVDLFNENDIVDNEGAFVYKSVEWTYYINPSFWMLQNNEHVIASLYFIMDMESLIEARYLNLEFFYGENGGQISYDEELPFGNKNLCKNMAFFPMPY